jgi:uncharacterized protein YuzE
MQRHIRGPGLLAGLNVLTLRPILAGMAKKPEPPPISTWDIFKIAKKSVWLGSVGAPDKAAAIEKAAQEFKTEAWRHGGAAMNMSSKTAHTTEFTLVDHPLPRPVEIIRLLSKGGLSLTIARSVVERIATTKIKGRYYHETNRVYIEITQEQSAESREVANGLNVDLDADGNVIGVNINNASRLGAL